MSFIRLGLQAIGNASRTGLQRVISVRSVSQSSVRFDEQQLQVEEKEEQEGEEVGEQGEQQAEGNSLPSYLYLPHGKLPDGADRRQTVPVEEGIRYLDSDAYKTTYGNDPVWKRYRRNFKGQKAPKRTRKTCIRNGFLTSGNPCPICRDEYLVLDHKNTVLLNQFISPYNGELIDYTKTGLCQMQHRKLLIAMYRAKDYGTVSFDVPFRLYDYIDWNPAQNQETKSEENQ